MKTTNSSSISPPKILIDKKNSENDKKQQTRNIKIARCLYYFILIASYSWIGYKIYNIFKEDQNFYERHNNYNDNDNDYDKDYNCNNNSWKKQEEGYQDNSYLKEKANTKDLENLNLKESDLPNTKGLKVCNKTVHRAFRRHSLKFHPDKHPDETEKYTEIFKDYSNSKENLLQFCKDIHSYQNNFDFGFDFSDI